MTGAEYLAEVRYGDRWQVEATPDGCLARVVDVSAVPHAYPAIRHVVASFTGETAHVDADRWAYDEHVRHLYGRRP